MKEERDQNDPKWKGTRFAAFQRDGFKCQKCGDNKLLQGHHIIRWADAPNLRYVLSNVITLCSGCHESVSGHEAKYAAEFQEIIRFKIDEKRQQRGINKKRFSPDMPRPKYYPKNPYLRF